MDSVFRELIEQFKASGEQAMTVDMELGREDRALLHQLAEEAGVSSYSVGSTNRQVVLSKETNKVYTPASINFFSKFSSIPIPVNDPALLEYYLDVLNPLYRSHEQFRMYQEAVEAFGSVELLRREINLITERILADLGSEKEKLNDTLKTRPK